MSLTSYRAAPPRDQGLDFCQSHPWLARPVSISFVTAPAFLAVDPRFRVAFPAEAKRSYSVLFSETLLPGSWLRLLDFPASRTSRYYRIVTPMQP